MTHCLILLPWFYVCYYGYIPWLQGVSVTIGIYCYTILYYTVSDTMVTCVSVL